MDKNTQYFPVMVCEDDLTKIGNTTYAPDHVNTSFVCNGDTYQMESIILRSILQPLGYKILDMNDYERAGGVCDMEINTDFRGKNT